ncbi:transcriptional corepressor LEUNIG-like [Citrus sinensis]|nr:transcriptional corepressor LEUNIG-like [Citrus sinensis]
MTEGKVATDPVAIDAPGGFLFEWWSVFWDIFISRTNDKHSENAAAYIETQQIKTREQQQLQMQQLQFMQHRNAQLQRRDPNHPSLGGSVSALNSEGMMGQPSASVLAMKMYEERTKHPHSMDLDTSPALMDANKMALLKATTNPQGQLAQGSSGNISAAMQRIQGRTTLTSDIKSEANLGATQKSLPMDPSSMYGQAMFQPKSVLGSSGLNQGVAGLPLKGWPLIGPDQLRPGLGMQVQKPNMQMHNQFLLASQQPQQVLAQGQPQNNLRNSTSYGDMDPRNFCQLTRGNMNVKDGQSTRNDGSICSPVQSSSPKMKVAQMQHSSSQHQDQLQQQQPQQLPQGNRKRKNSSSGAANSTGTGNTVGPSPNSPPSTHTPGDGITTPTSMQHVNNMHKTMMMNGSEGTGSLASASNLLEDIDRFADVGSIDENMESLLSHDGGDGRELYGTLKHSPEHQKQPSKGFTFCEVGCIRSRNSKVTCCHFSSDGKLLASSGHDRKVVLWNMDTLQTESTPEDHKSVVTDVRFRPNSSQLATASVDKSVRLWDAANGGTAQVRFQPRIGQLLAAASDKVVSIFDIETDRQTHSLQGHAELVNYICWDTNGDYLASVSQNLSLELWNMAENKSMTIAAHENIISALAQSPVTGMVASASHDSSVKLWK